MTSNLQGSFFDSRGQNAFERARLCIDRLAGIGISPEDYETNSQAKRFAYQWRRIRLKSLRDHDEASMLPPAIGTVAFSGETNMKKASKASPKNKRKPQSGSDGSAARKSKTRSTKGKDNSEGTDGQSAQGDFNIVCLGASAGGLESVTQLLKHLPADTGMAFVLVQHLDPTHESAM